MVAGRAASLVLAWAIWLHGQGPALPTDWAAVEKLPVGAWVRVEDAGGREHRGAVRNVSSTRLQLSAGKRTVEVSRAEARRVYRIVPGRKGRSTAIGAAVGAGIGTGTGAYLYSQGDFVKSIVPAFALFGAGIGALVGWLAGFRSESVPIYAAYPPPVTP